MSFGFSLVDAYIIHSRNFTCICNDWRLTHSSEICFIYILAVRFLVQCTQSVIGEKNRQEKRQHDREKKTRKKKNGRRVDLLVESLHYYGCLGGVRKQKNKDMVYAVCLLGMSMHTFILFFLDSRKYDINNFQSITTNSSNEKYKWNRFRFSIKSKWTGQIWFLSVRIIFKKFLI